MRFLTYLFALVLLVSMIPTEAKHQRNYNYQNFTYGGICSSLLKAVNFGGSCNRSEKSAIDYNITSCANTFGISTSAIRAGFYGGWRSQYAKNDSSSRYNGDRVIKHSNRGHKNRLLKSLDKYKPSAAALIRQCLLDRQGMLIQSDTNSSQLVIDRSIIIGRTTAAFASVPSVAMLLNTAVTTCPEPEGYKMESFQKCVLKGCMTAFTTSIGLNRNSNNNLRSDPRPVSSWSDS